jgi:hypothetical protein
MGALELPTDARPSQHSPKSHSLPIERQVRRLLL